MDKKETGEYEKEKGTGSEAKRWEMKEWERMRKFAFLRIREFAHGQLLRGLFLIVMINWILSGRLPN